MKNIIIILFISFAGVLFAQHPLDDSLSSRLKMIRSNYKLAGISVALIRNNTILAAGSAGLADISRSVPMTDSTLYRIASISKTVAATALMQLYEQGKFKLDDDVSSSMGFSLRNPNYPNDAITFRMVLSHTAGIVDGSGYDGFLSATGSNPVPSISSVLLPNGAYYTSDMWLNRKPGTYFTYTNMGFGVVGTLVERISGERFDQYCLKHLFRPLGLEASFSVSDLRNINNLAVLYRTSAGLWVAQADNYKGVQPAPRDLSSYVIGSNGSLFGPQGNLRISAKDLATFMIARMNGGIANGFRILNDSTAQLMNTPVWTYNGTNGDNYYGLFRCWGLGTHITTNTAKGDVVISGKTMAGHPGEAYGLISDAYYDVNKSGIGIVFLTNGRDGSYVFGASSAFYDVEEAVFAASNDFIKSAVTAVLEHNNIPDSRFALMQNYPNPFNPSTMIECTVPKTGRAIVKIFSIIGEEITTLFDGDAQGGVRYTMEFNASRGATAAGVYLLQLEYAGNVQRKKIMLLK
jgi:CubicO group peptidase (beta-lactamase class C family)